MEDSKFTIRRLLSPDEIIEHWEFFKQMPVIETTPEVVLARCLDGTYHLYKCSSDGKFLGIVVIQILNPEAICTVFVWAPNKVIHFRDNFYNWCRTQGWKHIVSVAAKPVKAYERLLDTKQLYTVFRKDL